MPKANDGLDPSLFESAGHPDITINRLIIKYARLRLNAAPFDAESVMSHPSLFQSREVFLEVSPTIESVPFIRGLAFGNKHIPVGVKPILLAGLHIGILVLVAGGRDAPGKLFLQLRSRSSWTRDRPSGVATQRIEIHAGGQGQRNNQRQQSTHRYPPNQNNLMATGKFFREKENRAPAKCRVPGCLK